MIDAGAEELKERTYREGLWQARAEGRAKGYVEGGANLVYRLARLKFGADTAERLSKVIKGITNPYRIEVIGDRIIQCETGAELLSRVVPPPADRDPERDGWMLRWELIKAWVRAEAELGVFSDEVVEEMEWLDKRITRMCESNGWPTGEQLLDFRREDQAD